MYLSSRRSVLAMTIVLVVAAIGFSQASQQSQTKSSGSISGQVTLDGRGARGVSVLLISQETSVTQRPLAKATTDGEGHYQMQGIPAGSYFLQAFAPALIGSTDDMSGRLGKPISLSDGESADGVDISLRPGGAITGRVTDADGQPLVQEAVRLFSMQGGRRNQVYLPNSNYMMSTDDRGIYRIFGIPPGKYIVGAGVDTTERGARINVGTTYYQLTFHPDTTEETKANIIELTAGGEASSVDIVLGRSTKGFSVSGRIVDAASNKPIVGMSYGYGVQDPQNGRLNITTSTSSTSNARGEFRIDGVTPGRYAAFATPAVDTDLYSDAAPFTVSDSDVSGVVVKVRLGTRIVGHLFLEGADGQPGVPRLSDIRLQVYSGSVNVAPRSGLVRVDPDGSFRTTGMPRGVANFSIAYPPLKGVEIVRVERDGVVQKDGIEIGSEEEITGVTIVFGYGIGRIRGQVKVENGQIDDIARMYVNIRRAGSNQYLNIRNPMPDARGRFTFEGLQPGEYDITLIYQVKAGTTVDGKPAIVSRDVKQTVTVTNGAESQVTMLLTLTAAER